MKRNIYNLISVLYSFVRFFLIKIFRGRNFCFRGIQRFSPNAEIWLGSEGHLSLGNKVRAHRHSKISVSNGGKLELGNNVALGRDVSIYCFDSITVGEYSEFGQGTKVYDHDHDFRVVGGYKERKFKTSPVVIGKNVWIGCNVVILRGTTIGDNCVVGAGCILNGTYPDNSIIVQKRETRIIEYDYKEKWEYDKNK